MSSHANDDDDDGDEEEGDDDKIDRIKAVRVLRYYGCGPWFESR